MSFKHAVWQCGAALLLATVALELGAASTNSVAAIHSAPPMKSAKAVPVKSAVVPLAVTTKSHVHQRRIELPALSSTDLRKIKQEDVPEALKRLRIGVGRE